MQPAHFQLHAEIEQRHWWFVGRRRIMRALIDALVPRVPPPTVHFSNRDAVHAQLMSYGGQPAAPCNPSSARAALSPPAQERPLAIDVGCGAGANIAALADRFECVGIDTSADAIEHARRRFPQVHFLRGRAPDDLGELVGRASLVTLMDVLEHVSDDFDLLTRILAAVRPGAIVLITVPADISLWSKHDESFGHYRRYDKDRLARLWQGLAVTPCLVSYFNSRLYPLVRTARALNRRLGRSLGQRGTDFWVPAAPLNLCLESWFAGESHALCRALRHGGPGYRRGVSLVAALRREPGPLAVISKPSDVAADPYDPLAGEYLAAV